MSRLSILTKPAILASALALAFAVAAPVSFDGHAFVAKQAFAKKGADDPAGHNAGDDKGGAKGKKGGKGRGGADDGANHQ